MSYMRFVSRVRPEVSTGGCVNPSRVTGQNIYRDPGLELFVSTYVEGPLGVGQIPNYGVFTSPFSDTGFQWVQGGGLPVYTEAPAPPAPTLFITEGQNQYTDFSAFPWFRIVNDNPESGNWHLRFRWDQTGSGAIAGPIPVHLGGYLLCNARTSNGKVIPITGACRSGDIISVTFDYASDSVGGGMFLHTNSLEGIGFDSEGNTLWSQDAGSTTTALVGGVHDYQPITNPLTLQVPDGHGDHWFRVAVVFTAFTSSVPSSSSVTFDFDNFSCVVTPP